jgi:hypothetical protein
MIEIALASVIAKRARMSTSLGVVDFPVKVICHKKTIFSREDCGKHISVELSLYAKRESGYLSGQSRMR